MPEEQKFNNNNEPPEPENKDKRKFRVYLSHDGFFRISFDKNKVAESFARENLPEEITRDLDFSTLALCKDTFVGRKLARSYSDVLYEIRFKNKPAYLYFLFEHKSWEPAFPGIQLFRELSDKTTFNEYLEMLLIYLGSNIKNVEFDQLQESVNDAIKEGGALMSTIFEEALEKGKEIGVKKGEEIGVKKGEEKIKIRVALNCLMKGMDIETISELTDLPVERIKLLKSALQEENASN
jgi:predicted transposase YdaD